MKTQMHDVLILGGGPGGATAASILAKKGIDVAIIEREVYPRFHIGESLLPASMPIFKEIGFYNTLNGGNYIQKYGARFIDYRDDAEVYFGFSDGLNTEIPMAFEVERCHFDKDILQHAVNCGAKLYQPERVVEIDLGANGVRLQTDKQVFEAEYVLDVTGRDSLVGKRMKMRHSNKDLNNVAVFAHFENVKRREGKDEGDITVGLLPDRAWTWIIPFKGAVTSVGVVCSSSIIDSKKSHEEHLMDSLRSSPSMADFMKHANRVGDIMTIGNYSHTCDKFYGDRYFLCGDAALFLDPIFSSGVHMSVSSSKLAAESVIKALPTKRSLQDADLGPVYEKHVRLGAARFHNLISLFYEGRFVEQMKKTLQRENLRKGFTSAVAGDVWNEDNFLFQKNIL